MSARYIFCGFIWNVKIRPYHSTQVREEIPNRNNHKYQLTFVIITTPGLVSGLIKIGSGGSRLSGFLEFLWIAPNGSSIVNRLGRTCERICSCKNCTPEFKASNPPRLSCFVLTGWMTHSVELYNYSVHSWLNGQSKKDYQLSCTLTSLLPKLGSAFE